MKLKYWFSANYDVIASTINVWYLYGSIQDLKGHDWLFCT